MCSYQLCSYNVTVCPSRSDRVAGCAARPFVPSQGLELLIPPVASTGAA